MLPYARQDVQDGRLVDICPVCGEVCDNERREYQRHFVKAHQPEVGERVRLLATDECPTEEYGAFEGWSSVDTMVVRVEPRYRGESDDGLRECTIDQVERLEDLSDDEIITGAMRAANAALDRRVRQQLIDFPDRRDS